MDSCINVVSLILTCVIQGRGDGPKAGTNGANEAARAYMGGLWAEPPMGSRSRAPGEEGS